jgi:hypothetical protein
VTPATTSLPAELGLLLAPIRITGVVSGRDHAGRAEGVILDDTSSIVAFVVRISANLLPGSGRTLVPVTAMTPADDGTLELSWGEDRLLEHPRLVEHDALPGAAPEPAVEQELEHPAKDMDPAKTATGTLAGTAVGAGLGALVAFALPPLSVLALAAFFATGGALIGVAAGASRHVPDKETDELTSGAHNADFAALERVLRDPTIVTAGFVRITTFEHADPEDQAAPRSSTTPRLRESA